MSYQVLARKWRPRSFREMVGQTHVLKALINALDNQRLHHAYLFTGTRGVGKTTIARILAKCLNCETGVSSTPCGECSVCREIDEGRFVDLIEVDAASRTKVEDTRELLDNVQYSPTRGRYKVYLIDEVHMLSSHSFNALLKTLEEPPPHVKFLLATTDPQKLPVTILSRCLQFSLKNMPPERVVEHLTHVLGAENVPFEDDALWLLGRAADGSMRDAMSLTDQAIAFGEGKVLAADVRAMLGTLDHGQVYGVLQALLEGDARALLEAVRHLAEQGPDWGGVLAEILNVLHRVAIAQALPEAIDNGQGDRERVLALAQALPAEDVQFYYQMGLIGRRDLPLAPDPRSGFEMVLLRMLAFRPADADGAPRTPLKDLGISKATTDPANSPVAGAASPAPVATVAPAPVVAAPVEAPEPLAVEAPSVPPAVAVEAVVETVLEALPAALPVAPDEQDEQDDEPPPADDYYEVDMDTLAYLDAAPEPDVVVVEEPLPAAKPATGLAAEWLELFPRLGLGGLTASIGANCTLVAADDDHWHLHLDPGQSALFNATQQRRLNDALNQHLGRTLKLEVTLQKPEQETPAQAAARRRAERQRAAEASIDADPLVRQLREQFAAVVRDGTIEPLEAKA
ncbi:DNA polymerase III subunit gamma/tau [Pseudomonas aeruginosa]|uniref:DNA polymerase III subunit gamma/tau n=1 Tax=Pseudomonas aeruginosa TaxID=287 RepID=UPI00067BBD9C|nr:DNA polymerase III subunit gamma/tau [Pseudomonas aeruginosa]